ncbi:hypothetical protein OS965_05080 [Streptomyces sp. H27-G5]|uniref:hypothetical protein n=1 Tax=Streptomyces sp. H27-G5 TaxID=2996698 RepID=UPI0022719999|nr:hypothetical protein [Streptomyces sp. H27-G5]MCY0917553.1 hypothetical protein [Streptomyces sp. H27-G5]
MPRRDLPPPPPPAHLREWLDESVVRADRARSLAELVRHNLGIERLLLLWAAAAVFALGWSFVGMALMAFEEGGPLACALGLVFAALAAGVLVPAGIWFGRGARLDRRIRQLQCAWAASDRDPAADRRLRAPGRSLAWLLASLALGALGLRVTFGAAAGTRPGEGAYPELFLTMGLGLILWVTALLGLGKAGAHYRWAMCALRSAGPAGPFGRLAPSGRLSPAAPARRSASTGRPPRASGTRSRSSGPAA